MRSEERRFCVTGVQKALMHQRNAGREIPIASPGLRGIRISDDMGSGVEQPDNRSL